MANQEAAGKALGQLARALGYARKSEAGDPELFEQFRNSVIQTFEYSWELTTKFLRRELAERAASADEITSLSFPDLLRTAAETGFIDSVERWLVFRAIRNKTSHGYEESFAAEAYSCAGEFLDAARELLAKLSRA
jgi:nucleotidyltransferase substrate binding protein (TIGR01987 family)